MSRRVIDVLLIAALIGVFMISLVLGKVAGAGQEETFAGTDATVTEMISEGGTQPWFTPIFTPGSGEIESGLFALQAALGGGALGYCAGRLHGRRRNERERDADQQAVATAQPTPAQPTPAPSSGVTPA